MAGVFTIDRLNCWLMGFAVRFVIDSLLASGELGLIANGGELQSRKQMLKFDQRFHRNLWMAKRKLRALWIQHPGRNGEHAAIDKLAYGAFTALLFLALVNAQRMAEQRVPTIVDRDGLKNMGIM